jgi:hypothetical protein
VLPLTPCRKPRCWRSSTRRSRVKSSPAAVAITREFRERNPGVNLMAQPIHTHDVAAAGENR